MMHSNIPYQPWAHTQVRALDLAAVRAYLSGVESLAREARTTIDPRVLLAALDVLRRQAATIREVLAL